MSKKLLCLAFVIALISGMAQAALVHQYTFEDGTADDSVGAADGNLVGDAAVVDRALVLDGVDDWMDMDGSIIDVNTYSEVSIEVWYTPAAGQNTGFTMLAYLGGFGTYESWGGSDYFFITSAREDDVSRAAISNGTSAGPWGLETGVDGTEYDDDNMHLMVGTIDSSGISLYIDGSLVSGPVALAAHNSINGISQGFVGLGKGGYTNDPEWAGTIHEFNIYDHALSLNEVQIHWATGPSSGGLSKAHDPDPQSGANNVGTANGNYISLTLSWKTGLDPLDSNYYDPNINNHLLYLDTNSAKLHYGGGAWSGGLGGAGGEIN
ncbi:MAG: hypothetical protein JW860_07630, partial [Sedimentisphaerales bacterium]|nr:hypothetical protein [Sedimentisphaerales bacterium]